MRQEATEKDQPVVTDQQREPSWLEARLRKWAEVHPEDNEDIVDGKVSAFINGGVFGAVAVWLLGTLLMLLVGAL